MSSITTPPADMNQPDAELDLKESGNGTAPLDYESVRRFTEKLCEPLEVEDYVVQSMDDVSPTKWHLAHTTWFFETFLLKTSLAGYQPFNGSYEHLFNSYYNSVGKQFPRPRRGILSRPTVEEIFEYRGYVDARMREMLDREEAGPLIEIGLNHEQQHQELMLTDIKHVLGCNPLNPVYRHSPDAESTTQRSCEWIPFEGGLRPIGHSGRGFAFDNENPRHEVLLNSFCLASRPVTCGEYLAFIEDGGYETPTLWLSDGWSAAQERKWRSPLYWKHDGDSHWRIFTLSGERKIDPEEPVCHVSYYEADAYARWAGARLPLEAEWETAAQNVRSEGNFVENGFYHPVSETSRQRFEKLLGDVWEWTASPYSPYPGFQAAAGALGEYNGKFMCNQFVLRGGSCATSSSHIRPTYRNFFPPDARWQFSGIRLAKDE